MKIRRHFAAACFVSLLQLGTTLGQIADEPTIPVSIRIPTNLPAVTVRNFPLDADGNLRVAEAVRPPKTKVIDVGEVGIPAGHEVTRVGPFDMDGFDFVSVQVNLLSGPSQIIVAKRWRNSPNLPPGYALGVNTSSEVFSVNSTDGSVALGDVFGKELFLDLRGVDSGSPLGVAHVVLYLRRNG